MVVLMKKTRLADLVKRVRSCCKYCGESTDGMLSIEYAFAEVSLTKEVHACCPGCAASGVMVRVVLSHVVDGVVG